MANFPQGFKVVLLASDEGIRNAAAAVLSACSYKVTPALSVDDCLQLCTVQRIDIVLAESSDLTTHREKTLQLMTALQNVPLIVMSESDTPSTMFHGLKIGAVDFLKRPLDQARVRSMWQHTLQRRMASVPVAPDEGSSQGLRRPVPLPEPPITRPALGTGLSEGSSNEEKLGMLSTLESAAPPQEPLIPETAQNFVPEPLDEQGSTTAPLDSASAVGATSTSPAAEPRKRAPRSAPDTQRRSKVRATGSTGSSSRPPPNGTTGMTMPPLLGIPPGCVPPVGSNGLAIGMPFLNQHPFVPTSPMNPINTYGFVPPFMYSHTNEPDLMAGMPSSLDPTQMAPFSFLQQPSLRTTEPFPTIPSTEPSPVLHRVSSTPVVVTQEPLPTIEVSSQEDVPDPSQRSLRKSPSLVNF